METFFLSCCCWVKLLSNTSNYRVAMGCMLWDTVGCRAAVTVAMVLGVAQVTTLTMRLAYQARYGVTGRHPNQRDECYS